MPDETIAVSTIIDTDRIRGDYGDLDSLVASIKEFGVIQPIVLAKGDGGKQRILVAGGRRLAALRILDYKELRHAKDFVWRDEDNVPEAKLRLQAVELEENLRRKDLSWGEVVAGETANR